MEQETDYRDLVAEHFDKQNQKHLPHHLAKHLAALGLKVSVEPVASCYSPPINMAWLALVCVIAVSHIHFHGRAEGETESGDGPVSIAKQQPLVVYPFRLKFKSEEKDAERG